MNAKRVEREPTPAMEDAGIADVSAQIVQFDSVQYVHLIWRAMWDAAPDADAGRVALHIVFDGPPAHESGRFVEVETPDGKSVKAGRWEQREDGYWQLVLTAADFVPSGGSDAR